MSTRTSVASKAFPKSVQPDEQTILKAQTANDASSLRPINSIGVSLVDDDMSILEWQQSFYEFDDFLNGRKVTVHAL